MAINALEEFLKPIQEKKLFVGLRRIMKIRPVKDSFIKSLSAVLGNLMLLLMGTVLSNEHWFTTLRRN